MSRARTAKTESRVLRLVDANANRAREGLRVVEDIARFVLDEKAAAKKAKTLRHSVTRLTLRAFAAGKLLDARDTQNDCGKNASYDRTGKRTAVGSILVRNLHRAQEAVRALEEFCAAGTQKAGFKKTRFELYRLEKRLVSTLLTPES